MTNILWNLLQNKDVPKVFDKPASKCPNINAMVKFFLEKDASIDDIFQNTDDRITPEYIADVDNWIDYKNLVILMKNCQDSVPNITLYDWYQAGMEIGKTPQTLAYRITIGIRGIQPMYKTTTRMTAENVTYGRARVNSIENGFCDTNFYFKDLFNEYGLGHAAEWFAGVLSAIPTARRKPPGEAAILFHQMKLRNLIEVLYGFKYQEDNDIILINDEIKGKKVELKEDSNKLLSPMCHMDTLNPNAILILEDVIKDGILYLKKGEMFDAPYTRMQHRWKKELYIVNSKYLVWDFWKHLFSAYSEMQRQRDVAYNMFFRLQDADYEKELQSIRAQKMEIDLAGGLAHDVQNPISAILANLRTIEESIPSSDFDPGDCLKQIENGFAILTDNLTGFQVKYEIPDQELKTLEPIIEDIYNRTEKLASQVPDLENLDEIVQHTSETTREVSRLISRFRDYASLTDPKKGYKRGMEDIDLDSLANSVLNSYKIQMKQEGIQCNLFIRDKKIDYIGDSIHIRRILENLVVNSIEELANTDKSTKKLIVSISQDTENVYIRVYDSGRGIKQDDLHKIFDIYYTTKTDKSGTRKSMSYGLGMVKKFVDLYGGTIDIKTREQKYACFKIALKKEQSFENGIRTT